MRTHHSCTAELEKHFLLCRIWKLFTSKPFGHVVPGLMECLPVYGQFSIQQRFKGPICRFLKLFYCVAPFSMKLCSTATWTLNSNSERLVCLFYLRFRLSQKPRMCLHAKCQGNHRAQLNCFHDFRDYRLHWPIVQGLKQLIYTFFWIFWWLQLEAKSTPCFLPRQKRKPH